MLSLVRYLVRSNADKSARDAMALRTTNLAKCYLYYCVVIFESLVLNHGQLTVTLLPAPGQVTVISRLIQFMEVILFLCLKSSVHTDGHAKITGRLREGMNSWKKLFDIMPKRRIQKKNTATCPLVQVLISVNTINTST